ncbi:TPA: ATP-dependent sacrificial sulfur transferase LarE [Streptococcus suis]
MSKEEKLAEILTGYGRIALAFSGGIDSSFLLLKAKEILGRENVLAVIIDSKLIRQSDTAHAISFAQKHNIWFEVLRIDELKLENIRHYTVDSWYHSKILMYSSIITLAQKYQITKVVDGMIVDDLFDVRPGLKARDKLGVFSPLQIAGFSKVDVRNAAKKITGISWNQPPSCSVMSRFPYGSLITSEKIRQVMKSETFLAKIGLEQVRVRHHGSLARIEVCKEQMVLAFEKRDEIVEALKSYGFIYISLDLLGYETGRMNEELQAKNSKEEL